MVNPGKKDGSAEVEAFQQVIVELRAEVISLTEQLEQEKKAARDAKSLKTKQISTLTSKLVNEVRQRVQAEEELAKVNKEVEELKEVLRLQVEEREAKDSENDTDNHITEDESSTHQRVGETDEAVNTQDNIRARHNNTALSCLQNDGINPVNEVIENGIGSFQLENKCDPLSTEGSLDEILPTNELSQSTTHTDLSLSLSSALSDSSFQDKQEDLFHLELLRSSWSEMYDSNHIIHSFESQEEKPEEKKQTIQEFMQIDEDLCEVQENMNHDQGEDVQNVTGERQNILETAYPSSGRQNRRIGAENSEKDQESSPPSSPEAAPSSYTSNSTDELVNLLMCHGVEDEYRTTVFTGNEDKEQEVHPKGFLNDFESDDVTRETTTAQDKKSLEHFITREEAAESELNTKYKALEERCLNFKTAATANEAEKGDRQRSELQNGFLPHTMSEEFWDLKQQLKNALKEIEELRLENKEMKKEIQNLSSSTSEKEFLQKTTKFTERLLKEMKEREAKMYVARGVSYLEKYGLDRDNRNPGSTDLSQMRSAGDMNQSVGKKTSLPLKIIGSKLKELRKSVENMATDPELCQENVSEVCLPDFMGYKQRHPILSGQFGLEESLIMPVPCCEKVSQSTAFPQENLRENLPGGGYTSVENLGEKSFLASSKIQPQFLEEACAWKENKFQLNIDRETEERSWPLRTSDFIGSYFKNQLR